MDARTFPRIEVDPSLTADQLFEFYTRNNICEAEFGRQVVGRVLEHPQLIVAALEGAILVGIGRATFDGLSAHIMELSLDLRWQGETRHRNGSLIESDPKGLAAALGQRLLTELRSRGSSFVSVYIVAECEEPFYAALGLRENSGHLVYYLDERPYAGATDERPEDRPQ